MNLRRFVWLVWPFFILLSCDVQKRHYRQGYHVTSNKHKQAIKAKIASAHTEPKIQAQGPINFTTAEIASEKSIVKAPAKKTAPPDSCDRFVMHDGSELSVLVKELGPGVIKYKRCDMPEGPVYVCKKSEVFMIRYKSGMKEVIDPAEKLPETKNPKQKYQEVKKVTHPAATSSFILSIISFLLPYIWAVAFPLRGTGLLLPMSFLSVLVALVTVLAGNYALNRINDNPDYFKGRNLAITALTIGGIVLIVMFAILIVALAAL